jgi:hypothetical protein
MATATKFHACVEHVYEKVHNFAADQFALALSTNANAPSASADAVLADFTQIAYTNLSSRNLTTSSSSQTSGTFKWVVADLTLTASGGAVATFRHITVYNDTPTSPADPLVQTYDYGSDLTLADGESLLFDADGTNGLLQAA